MAKEHTGFSIYHNADSESVIHWLYNYTLLALRKLLNLFLMHILCNESDSVYLTKFSELTE